MTTTSESTQSPPAARSGRLSTPQRIILAIVLIADVLDLMDSTITNIAAPTIAADIGGGESQVQDQDREHESAERRPGPGGHAHRCRPGRSGRGAVPPGLLPAGPGRPVRSATAVPLRPRPDCTSASVNPAGLDPLCRAGGDGVKAAAGRAFPNDLHGATPPARRCPR